MAEKNGNGAHKGSSGGFVTQFTEPAVAAIYGQSKQGKTTDLIYTFPRGFFIAPPGALKPSVNVVGYTPVSYPADSIDEAIALAVEASKVKGQDGKPAFDAVVFDDFSLLAEKTMNAFEKKHAKSSNRYAPLNDLRDAVIRLRDTCRSVGLHVAITAHEIEPRQVSGSFVRGGPRLPGKLTEDLPVAVDIILRATTDAMRKGWPGVYICDKRESSWITGDRHGVCPPKSPMNLGEILRLAKYAPRRAPGLEWQDDLIDGLCEAYTGAGVTGDPRVNLAAQEINKQAVPIIGQRTDSPLFLRWTLRDAADRFWLRAERARLMLEEFGLGIAL